MNQMRTHAILFGLLLACGLGEDSFDKTQISAYGLYNFPILYFNGAHEVENCHTAAFKQLAKPRGHREPSSPCEPNSRPPAATLGEGDIRKQRISLTRRERRSRWRKE